MGKREGQRGTIALYMRLSKESKSCENAQESDSIRAQRALLRRYAAAHFAGCKIVEFEDDGYSGTHFDRPGISALFELVRAGGADCILVKDFSRFSRDHLELGAYLEQIFPFLGVRFISVNDGYDSADGMAGDLDTSFKGLLYDLYSKDLSVKVKTSLAAKRRQGEYVSANCPFGYRRAGEDGRRLAVEEEEAAVVRRIFALAGQGLTSTQIARRFNEEGIKTPAGFKKRDAGTGRGPKGGLYVWQSSSVCRILKNPVYAGDMVWGKYEKEAVGGRSRMRPRQEWQILREHHEPIVERELFEQVQGRTGGGGRAGEKGRAGSPDAPLRGCLVCAGCGRNLYRRAGKHPCYVCPSLYVRPDADCVRRADEATLERYVLDGIRAREEEQEKESRITGAARKPQEKESRSAGAAGKPQEQGVRSANAARKSPGEGMSAAREENRTKRQAARLYAAYAEGGMDAEEYRGKAAKIKQRREALYREREKREKESRAADGETGEGSCRPALTAQLVRAHIKQILVSGDGTWRIDFRDGGDAARP